MDCMPLMRSPDEWDVPLGLKLLSVCRWGGRRGSPDVEQTLSHADL